MRKTQAKMIFHFCLLTFGGAPFKSKCTRRCFGALGPFGANPATIGIPCAEKCMCFFPQCTLERDIFKIFIPFDAIHVRTEFVD